MFNLLLTSVMVFTFSVEFENNFNTEQEYFYFENRNQLARLHRVNNTLTLVLQQGENCSVYSSTIKNSNFTFSWLGFKVNERKMEKEISCPQYETISSPLRWNLEPITENVYSCSEGSFNYWYIMLMIILSGAFFESKSQGMQMLKRLVNPRNNNVQPTVV